MSETLTERYRRAIRQTAPKLAARRRGGSLDGYWLDETLYFYLSERMETFGGLVHVPCIYDASTAEVAEVLSHEALVAALTAGSAEPVTAAVLRRARFDMPDRDTLAVSVRGWDYLIDVKQQRLVSSKPSFRVRALYSPNKRFACFLKGSDLWLAQLEEGTERSLTTDGVLHCAYAQEPASGLEALSYRRSPYPVALWDPDSEWILTHQIDEREVRDGALIQHVPPGGGPPILHHYKYPLPCDRVPSATLVAIHAPSGRTVRFADLPFEIAGFSPFTLRRAWFAGDGSAWIVRLDRFCQTAELIRLDLEHGNGRVVISERVTLGYLDLHPLVLGTPNVRVLPASKEAIWFSERDGWGHLYLYDTNTGALRNRITHGEWLVRDLVRVDEGRRRILFLASGINEESDPAHRALCCAKLDGSGLEILLHHAGDVYVPVSEPAGPDQHLRYRPASAQPGISPGGDYCVARYSSLDAGNRAQIVHLQRRDGVTLDSVTPEPSDLQPRHVQTRAADGKTELRGILFMPRGFDERRCYPLVDVIYPGPQIFCRPQGYQSLLAAQAYSLAELGFVALVLDTRGTPLGSRSFRQAGYGELLEPQLADHAAVVQELCTRFSFIDVRRIGILGQSAGGAAAARALFDYGDIYKVGVAVCGNHDASQYAAFWSDKYRGPGSQASWVGQSNVAAAGKLSGKLLLISGDMDENVHVSQTLSLADALIRCNRDFDMLIMPNAGHLVLVTHAYAQRKAWDYLVRHLLGEEPPREVEVSFDPEELELYASQYRAELRQL